MVQEASLSGRLPLPPGLSPTEKHKSLKPRNIFYTLPSEPQLDSKQTKGGPLLLDRRGPPHGRRARPSAGLTHHARVHVAFSRCMTHVYERREKVDLMILIRVGAMNSLSEQGCVSPLSCLLLYYSVSYVSWFSSTLTYALLLSILSGRRQHYLTDCKVKRSLGEGAATRPSGAPPATLLGDPPPVWVVF